MKPYKMSYYTDTIPFSGLMELHVMSKLIPSAKLKRDSSLLQLENEVNYPLTHHQSNYQT